MRLIDPIRIGLEDPDRYLWLSIGRHGLQLQLQADMLWSEPFAVSKRDLDFVALGALPKVELTREDGSVLRIGWRGGFVVEWETDERTLREQIDMAEFLGALQSVG